MTAEDVKVVQESLWEVRSKWRNLGIQLDMKPGDLEAIGERSSNPDDCFTDCILCWLKQGNPPPTWRAVIKALRSPTVGFQGLAEELEIEYLQCSSIAESANNDEITLRFPHIDEVAMNEQQRKELEQRLKLETKEIMTEFHILINRFFDTLEDKKCPIERLTRYLEKELCKELVPQPKDIKQIQCIIDKNSTFYDHRFLKYMIRLVGEDSDKKGVEEYEKRFKIYAQRRVFECPCEFGAKRTPTDTELHVKLDSNYQCLHELEEFQIRLCSILNVHIFVTRLFSIEKGCFKLLFLLPQHIQASVFPLSKEQERELDRLGVLNLSCNDYHFIKSNLKVANKLNSYKVMYIIINICISMYRNLKMIMILQLTLIPVMRMEMLLRMKPVSYVEFNNIMHACNLH